MIALVHVTFEIVASGETHEDVIRDAIDGVRGFRGAAVHVEVHDQRIPTSPPPARQADTDQPAGE